MLMGKKIKYLCSWEIEKRQNTHAQGNKYTFSALREKVIYLIGCPVLCSNINSLV